MEKTKILATLMLALFLVCGLAAAAMPAQMAALRGALIAPAQPFLAAYLLHVGDAVQTAHFSVALADVGMMQGENGNNPAVLEIRNRNGNLIDSILISPGFGFTLVHNDQGLVRKLNIRVHATGNAQNRQDRWATISVVETRG